MTFRKNILAVLLASTVLGACNDSDFQDGAPATALEEDHNENTADVVMLTPDAAAEAGIVVSQVERTALRQVLSLPAELRYDADRIAAVSPQVSGRISSLVAGEGDRVDRGAILAVLASRELANLKAEYLTAVTTEDLARQSLKREETLFADRITSEADLQRAQASLAASRANREGVESKLHAVGVSDDDLATLADAPDGALVNARLRAPISGVIAQRVATLGASVSADDPSADPLFTIVDGSVLWADIAVYKQDADRVQSGATVLLKSEDGTTLAEGEIATVLPAIDETSRTATARAFVDNPDGLLRPGQFVTADIITDSGQTRLHVPAAAIVEVEGRPSVFVPVDNGFTARNVSPGSTAGSQTIILSGLSEGQTYVSEGAFTLKAQLEKDAFGDDHDH